MRPAVLLTALLAAAPAASAQKGRALRGAERPDGPYTRIELRSGAVGYLFAPPARKGRRPGLLVMLHGHGGTPKRFLLRDLARARGDLMLAVQGTRPVSAGGRQGYGWDALGGPAIADLVRYVLAHRAVDPKGVVLIGHSAGGTMALEAYRAAPKRFAGLITIAAPRTPTTAHKKARLWVFLGTRDPNFAVAPTVRAFFAKRRWKQGVLAILAGAGHNDLPAPALLLLAVEWCLAGKARGGEVELPYEARLPPLQGDLGLLLVAYDGRKGPAPRSGRRTRSAALKLVRKVARALTRKRAYFPFEALAHSDHPSYASGGYVSRRRLADLGREVTAAAAKLEPGAVSAVLETPQGFVLLWRRPEGG